MPMMGDHAKGSGDSGSARSVLTQAILCHGHAQEEPADKQINVNWLYGSYIPKGAPRLPLNGHQRGVRGVRQKNTTPHITVKQHSLRSATRPRTRVRNGETDLEGSQSGSEPPGSNSSFRTPIPTSFGKPWWDVGAALRPLHLRRRWPCTRRAIREELCDLQSREGSLQATTHALISALSALQRWQPSGSGEFQMDGQGISGGSDADLRRCCDRLDQQVALQR